MAFDLNQHELNCALILVTECLAGMGGDRPSDLESDEYTWIDVKMLTAHGYTMAQARGYFSALMAKGVISEYDKNEPVLETAAWRWLDTKWDGHVIISGKDAADAPVATAPVTGAETKKGRALAMMTCETGVTADEISKVLGVTLIAAKALVADNRRDGHKVTATKVNGATFYKAG